MLLPLRGSLGPLTASRGGAVAAPSSLLTGLVGAWKMDETSGQRNDSSPNGNHLTDVNTVGYGAGKIGNAASFNPANNEYLYCTCPAVLKSGASPWTVWLWWKATDGTQRGIASVGTYPADGGPLWILQQQDANTVRLFTGPGTYQWPSSAPINAWHLAVITWASPTLTLQIDGGTVQSKSTTISGNSSYLYFGTGYPVPINGLVDEPGALSRVLTDAERITLWNGGAGKSHPYS